MNPSLPPLHQAVHPSQVEGCLFLIYTKMPEPCQLCCWFASLSDWLTTATSMVAPSLSLATATLKRLLPCPICAESLPRSSFFLPLVTINHKSVLSCSGSLPCKLASLMSPTCLGVTAGGAVELPPEALLVFIQIKVPNASVSYDPNTSPAPIRSNKKKWCLCCHHPRSSALKLSYSLLLTLPSSFPSAAY